MEFKRIWPKLLIISSVIAILGIIVFLKATLNPDAKIVVTNYYEDIMRYVILLSIIPGSMIIVGCAYLLKESRVFFAIPLSSQIIALGLSYPYRWWSPYLPRPEFGLNYFLTSLIYCWVLGGLEAVVLYEVFKESISTRGLEWRKWIPSEVGTVSLVLGIIGLIAFEMRFDIFGPLAAIFGAIGWRKNKDNYALTGMIIGTIGFLISILYWVFVLGIGFWGFVG